MYIAYVVYVDSYYLGHTEQIFQSVSIGNIPRNANLYCYHFVIAFVNIFFKFTMTHPLRAIRHTHTHARTRTHIHIYIYIFFQYTVIHNCTSWSGDMFRLIMQAIIRPKFNNFSEPLQVGVRSHPLKIVIHCKILRKNTRSLDRFIKCVILQKC